MCRHDTWHTKKEHPTHGSGCDSPHCYSYGKAACDAEEEKYQDFGPGFTVKAQGKNPSLSLAASGHPRHLLVLATSLQSASMFPVRSLHVLQRHVALNLRANHLNQDNFIVRTMLFPTRSHSQVQGLNCGHIVSVGQVGNHSTNPLMVGNHQQPKSSSQKPG